MNGNVYENLQNKLNAVIRKKQGHIEQFRATVEIYKLSDKIKSNSHISRKVKKERSIVI